MHRRVRRGLAIAIGWIALLAFASAVVADDDVTPPAGTLVIEGGTDHTTDGLLELDVAATDDVGVATVRVGLLGGPLTDYPYAPHVVHSIGDVSKMAQQQLTLYVEWRDAAGNASSTQRSFWLDWAAPDLQTFRATSDERADGTVTFSVGAYEETTGVAAIRFSTNGGSTWGAEIPLSGPTVVWPARDASKGGKPNALGQVSVWAQVRDGVGQWSNVRSTTVTMVNRLSIGVSAAPTTGRPVTLSADWAHPIALPSGAMCLWEFMWGNDRSLFYGDRDETFGYLATQGLASKGFCDSWTFTLPWTPVRRYVVSLRVMQSDWTTLGEHTIGGSPSDPSFTASVGSTDRHIRSSNLPMFYVLPDSYELVVGQPAVYRGYALGGATIRSSDRWIIEYVNTPETHPGSAVLTFYPKRTGHITVCLSRGFSAGTQISACFDPPVKAGSGTGGTGGGGGGGSGSATPGPSATLPAEALASPSVAPASPTASVDPSATASPSPEPSSSPGDVAVVPGSPSPLASAGPSSPVANQPGTAAPALVALAVVGLALAGGLLAARPGARQRLSQVVGSIRARSGRS